MPAARLKERVARLVEGWRLSAQPLAFVRSTLFGLDEPERQLSMRVGGISFVLRSQEWHSFREIFVEDEYGIVRELFPPGSTPAVIADLGANVGLFSIFVFSLMPHASVIAVEPSRSTFAVLSLNRDLNPGLDWRCCRAAIAENDGAVRLLNAPQSTSSRIAPEGEEEVPGLSLASLAAAYGLSSVDLMKLDVEGAEERALSGSLSFLPRVRNVLVEVHPEVDLDSMQRLLDEQFQYLYRVRHRASAKPLLLATRRARSSDLLEPLS